MKRHAVLGVAGLLMMCIGWADAQDRQKPGFTTSVNAVNVTANRLVDISESPPLPTECDDPSDLGRVVLHSAGNTGSIFFCVQGRAPNYQNPRWFVVRGTQFP